MEFVLKASLAVLAVFCLYNFGVYWRIWQKLKRDHGHTTDRLDLAVVCIFAAYLFIVAVIIAIFAKS